MNLRTSLRLALWLSAIPLVALAAAQGPPQGNPDEPFKGVTTNGTVVPGLFTVKSTGVSTAPVRDAAVAFLAALTPEQRQRTTFAVDDSEWRKWNNVHRGAPGRQLQGDVRRAARESVRSAEGRAQRQRARAVAQHHAPQRDHRRDDEAARGIWRRAL